MLSSFFQITPVPHNQLIGSFDIKLVVLSYIVAVLASYVALDIAGQLRSKLNTRLSNFFWLTGGAVSMGAGIWSMHFIGMQAFSLQNVEMYYDRYWTAASLIVAIASSGLALYLIQHTELRMKRLAVGGFIIGIGIAAMHYLGMQAMAGNLNIRYFPGLFIMSIIIGIAAAEAALCLAIKSTQVIIKIRLRLKIISALIMGVGICGMHYIGMFAAVFSEKQVYIHHEHMQSHATQAIIVATITFIILCIPMIMSIYRESANELSLQAARKAGMADVAASVLHSVGNTLNSVVVSSQLIRENLNDFQLSKLSSLANLLEKQAHNLPDFLSHDEQGKKIIEYIRSLSSHMENKKENIHEETISLTNNIEKVKKIISLQEEISRSVSLTQLISIHEVIDEAITLNSLNYTDITIKIIKNYGSLKPVQIDKFKLLQIILCLLQYASNSLVLSSNKQKNITINTGESMSSGLYIEIIDTGQGILAENMSSIYSPDFNTKPSSLNFDLHNSMIAIKELGGSLTTTSSGFEKGTTFRLSFPLDK